MFETAELVSACSGEMRLKTGERQPARDRHASYPDVSRLDGKVAVMLVQIRRIRMSGHCDRLRLRQHGRWGQDPLEDLRECCGASMAMDKALAETIHCALAAGARWQEIGRTLEAPSLHGPGPSLSTRAANRREVWPQYLE